MSLDEILVQLPKLSSNERQHLVKVALELDKIVVSRNDPAIRQDIVFLDDAKIEMMDNLK